jgi:hypothetical protein
VALFRATVFLVENGKVKKKRPPEKMEQDTALSYRSGAWGEKWLLSETPEGEKWEVREQTYEGTGVHSPQ